MSWQAKHSNNTTKLHYHLIAKTPDVGQDGERLSPAMKRTLTRKQLQGIIGHDRSCSMEYKHESRNQNATDFPQGERLTASCNGIRMNCSLSRAKGSLLLGMARKNAEIVVLGPLLHDAGATYPDFAFFPETEGFEPFLGSCSAWLEKTQKSSF